MPATGETGIDVDLIAATTAAEATLVGQTIALVEMLAEAYQPGLSDATKAAIFDGHAAWTQQILRKARLGDRQMRPTCNLKPGVTVVPKHYYANELGFEQAGVERTFLQNGIWFVYLTGRGVVPAYKVSDIIDLEAA